MPHYLKTLYLAAFNILGRTNLKWNFCKKNCSERTDRPTNPTTDGQEGSHREATLIYINTYARETIQITRAAAGFGARRQVGVNTWRVWTLLTD